MKKRGIFTTILIALAAVAFAIPTQLFTGIRAFDTNLLRIGPAITVANIPTSGKLGEYVFIPAPSNMGVVTADDDDKTYRNETAKIEYKLEVMRAKEGTIALELYTQAEVVGWRFRANYTGTYTFRYIADSIADLGAKTISSTSPSYSVVITGPEAQLSLPVNSIYTVPSILPLNTSVKFPAAIVDKDGSNGVTTAYLVRNGVRVKTFTEADIVTDSKGVKHYSPYTLTVAGTYTLTYQYQVGSSEPVTLVKKYEVKTNHSIADLELTLNFSNAPSTATLGVGEKIPTPTVVDANGNTIESYIKIEVYKVINDTDSTLVTGVMDGYTFTAKEPGDYRIYYTAIANYGDTTVESARKSFKLTGVSDTVAPTSYAVNSYEMGTTGLSVDGITAVNGKTIQEIFLDKTGVNHTAATFADLTDSYKREILMLALGDLSYAIPSTAVVGEAITIPAIYATDNYSVFGGVTNGIEVVRQIKLEGSDTVQPIKEGEDVVFSGDVATYTFTTEGTHTIRYYAKDTSTNNNEEVELAAYTIIVTDTASALTTPTIKMPTVPASVEKTATISFTMEKPTDIHDERVEYHVYWSFTAVDEASLTAEAIDAFEELFVDKNGKYAIDLSKYTEVQMGDGSVYIYVIAINDRGGETINKDSILIKNIGLNKDSAAPSIVTDSSDYIDEFKTVNGLEDGAALVFPQGTQIKLPAYVISDNMGASMNVAVADEYGNTVKVKNASPIASEDAPNTLYTISTNSLTGNAYFTAASGGIHYITYYAIDGGNNIVAQTFSINVRIDNASPDYIQTEILPTTIEKGVYYELPGLVMMNGTQKIDPETHDIVLYWEVNSTIQMIYDYDGTTLVGFTALEITGDGEYIAFIAKGSVDGVEVTPKTYRRTSVTDAIKPTLTPETTYALPAQVDYTAGMEIYLPNYEAVDKDSKGNVIENISNITVTATSGSTKATVTSVVEDLSARDGGSSGIFITRYKFTPSKIGVWTVTYSATDESGLTSTSTLTIKVGDCDAPELTWTNKTRDLISEATIGDSYELKLDYFKISDEDTEDMTAEEYLAYISDSDYVNIYLSDPNSATVTNELADATTKGYKWTFSNAGNYTLYFKLTDKAGNPQTYSYIITVDEEDIGSTTDKSDVLGIVLITIACTITAGVIGYFIYTGIKSVKEKSGKKDLADKNDKNDKIVK